MYLSTMQDILRDVSKVVIDTEASSNMLYVPLDQLTGSSANRPGVRPSAAAAGGALTSDPNVLPAAARGSADNAQNRPAPVRGLSPYDSLSQGAALQNPLSSPLYPR